MEEYVKNPKNAQSLVSWANYIKLMRPFHAADPNNDKTIRGLFRRSLTVVKD